METNHNTYDFEKSRERIDEILDAKDTSYEEVDEIPSRDKLTFKNGFYIKHTAALFVDIRKSSELPDKYKRPKLAKIYRSYLSEVVAIINDNIHCAEIIIQGDCVSGIFDAKYKKNFDTVVSTSARISSIIDTLNCKYKKYDIDPITVGIGIDYGRVLMIKAGYKGSGINDVVWMGDVVNQASNLCGYGNKTWTDRETMISNVFYNNLNDDNKKLFSYNSSRNCYHGNIVNTAMDKWIQENNCNS